MDDDTSKRIEEEAALLEFYNNYENSYSFASILLTLSPKHIKEYELLFPELKFEESYEGCTYVTFK